MNRSVFSLLLLFLISGLLTSKTVAPTSADPPPQPGPTVELTIMYTHDTHSHLYPQWTGSGCSIGMSLLATLVNQIRAEKPLLMLDCGDTLSGGATNDLNHGLPMMEVMNTIGYDAMALDNHEFDQSLSTLKGMITAADFDIVSANTQWPGSPQTENYTIVEVAGLRVGIIGLIPSFWYAPPEVTFTDMEDAAIAAAAELAAQGVNFTIVLGCLGSGTAQSLAENVPGLDIIVKASGPQIVNGTLICPSVGSWTSSVGMLNVTISVSNGTVLDYTHTAYSLTSPPLSPDSAIEAIIDTWDAPLATALNAPVGYAENQLSKGELGSLLAESLRLNASTDIGLYNYGGVRDTISSGFITYRGLYHVEPFFNFLATVQINGSIAETVCSNYYSSTTITSFNPSASYTLASSNFTITELEHNYPSDVTNRQDYQSITVVQALADHLSGVYSVSTSDLVDALTKARTSVNNLPDSSLTGGTPSTLRNTITSELNMAIDTLNQDNTESSLSHTNNALDLIEIHINGSCPQRWLNITLNCVIHYISNLNTTTTPTTTTDTTSPPPIPGFPWQSVILSIIITLVLTIVLRRNRKGLVNK
ncbi:MAG: bifunctional metallophosphatase/5'-nucleotidase [Promethearchaeota archaeon]